MQSLQMNLQTMRSFWKCIVFFFAMFVNDSALWQMNLQTMQSLQTMLACILRVCLLYLSVFVLSNRYFAIILAAIPCVSLLLFFAVLLSCFLYRPAVLCLLSHSPACCLTVLLPCCPTIVLSCCSGCLTVLLFWFAAVRASVGDLPVAVDFFAEH